MPELEIYKGEFSTIVYSAFARVTKTETDYDSRLKIQQEMKYG